MATPYVTVVRNAVTSTQDLAAEMLDTSWQPVLVVAAEQTTGRGRGGNDWWQATRAVAASLAIPERRLEIDETFSLAAGLTVRSAVFDIVGVVVDLKWPNDLLRGDGKVGGILVERKSAKTVVGCGLNLFWPDAPAGAGALLDEDPGAEVGRAISERWAVTLLASGGRWDRGRYLDACSTVGAEVTWQPSGRGTVVTIDESGGLVVATEEGTTVLRSGEVSTVRRVN